MILPDSVSFTVHMMVKKSNKPFMHPTWCCNTQITKQP